MKAMARLVTSGTMAAFIAIARIGMSGAGGPLRAAPQTPPGAQAPAGRGAPAAPRPDNPQSLAHIDAARKLAGNDAWLRMPFNFYCVAGGARANNANAPELEPIKLFDNVYAVGNSETTVYAITTAQGI